MIADAVHLSGERARDGAQRDLRWLPDGSGWRYGERTNGGRYLPRSGAHVHEVIVKPSGVSMPQPDEFTVLWYGSDGWKRLEVSTAGPGAWSMIRNSWAGDRWTHDGLDYVYDLDVGVEWRSGPAVIRGP